MAGNAGNCEAPGELATLRAGAPAMSCAAYRAIENMRAHDMRDAAWLADRIIESAIEMLRKDAGLPLRNSQQWDLALADLRSRVTEQIARTIVGRVDLSQVLSALEADGEQ
jgi:hypothetical protein